ncbi:serine/arginine repetitive matrix protein 1 isoform X2 [Plodia interpunctella]|uniref:serine/arginine repetitive matrix protein 1 isoform X2 n=1 Tax=Plodia interpunctella TaxID=58824 RepID=UPI0023685D5E|nr:serine/arginine repetitive matrix protein 1 isoform X2 [Plodia interpunctella]
MVINTKPHNLNLLRKTGSKIGGGGGAALATSGLRAEHFVVKANRELNASYPNDRPYPEEADDVIDLGAPRLRRALTDSPGPQRRIRSYTPNPRLYPGPPKKPEPKNKKRAEGRGRRHKRVYKRPVPNARLYRPAPPRPRPPPQSPWRGGHWPPPAPTQSSLATASLAALQLTQTRPEHAHAPPSRRLVVTLPAQRHTMDHVPRNSEEGSDGNDTLSAPSEFLAEFLSAIMQRQYSEALKYCRLILQYEPHNSTARGFYSLLQHKVSNAPAAAPPSPPTPPSPVMGRSPAYPINLNCEPGRQGSSSADSSPQRPHTSPVRRRRPPRLALDVAMGSSHDGMEQEADESTSSSSAAGAGAGAARRDVSPDAGSESDDSCASQSSLELDSSPSLSLSRRTDHTDSASGSGAGWFSSGTPPSSGSGSGSGTNPPDDNGNAPLTPERRVRIHADDMQNDNGHTSPLKSTPSSETLRRLRAQFTCSIK